MKLAHGSSQIAFVVFVCSALILGPQGASALALAAGDAQKTTFSQSPERDGVRSTATTARTISRLRAARRYGRSSQRSRPRTSLRARFLATKAEGELPAGFRAMAGGAPKIGERGTQVPSQTLRNTPKYRLDVENPAPGVRDGQIHIQAGGEKYQYDFVENGFPGLPNGLRRVIEQDSQFNARLQNGLRVLGEGP